LAAANPAGGAAGLLPLLLPIAGARVAHLLAPLLLTSSSSSSRVRRR
jgi:hypothetical protein